MGIFHSEPPARGAAARLRLERVPPKGRLDGIITSTNWVGAYTHYAAGRTRPCTGSDCRWCGPDTSRRWHCYCGLLIPAAGRHIILELTHLASEPIIERAATAAGIRGSHWRFVRSGPSVNSRVEAWPQTPPAVPVALPKAPALEELLKIIWGIDAAQQEAKPPQD